MILYLNGKFIVHFFVDQFFDVDFFLAEELLNSRHADGEFEEAGDHHWEVFHRVNDKIKENDYRKGCG